VNVNDEIIKDQLWWDCKKFVLKTSFKTQVSPYFRSKICWMNQYISNLKIEG
jgi:hypothetical protein